MKKQVLLVASFLCGLSLLAETSPKFTTPEAIAKQKETYTKLIAEKKTDWDKAYFQMNYDLIDKDVKSFAEMRAVGDEACKKYNCTTPSPLGWYPGVLKSWDYSKTLKKQFWDVCLAENSDSIRYLTYFSAEDYGITDKEFFDQIVKVLNSDNFQKKPATNVSLLIDQYINYANKTNAADADVKAQLKKLNRAFTSKLLNDKTTWEPVVAKIRSLIETY